MKQHKYKTMRLEIVPKIIGRRKRNDDSDPTSTPRRSLQRSLVLWGPKELGGERWA